MRIATWISVAVFLGAIGSPLIQVASAHPKPPAGLRDTEDCGLPRSQARHFVSHKGTRIACYSFFQPGPILAVGMVTAEDLAALGEEVARHLGVSITLALAGACTCQGKVRLDLPTSNGPFELTLPPPESKTLAFYSDGSKVLPPTGGQARERLAVRADAGTPWGKIAGVLLSSATAGEKIASFYVQDAGGQKRTVRLPLTARLTGPLLIPDDPAEGIELIPNEHVIKIEVTTN